MNARPRIAIAFFGITRSLRFTISSLQKNLLSRAGAVGEVKIFGHFFRQHRIENIRSGESIELDPEEYRLLEADNIRFSEPGSILTEVHFDALKAYGDHWEDHFKTMSNLMHQLYSLKSVTAQVLIDCPDVVVFCRPDLEYHDSFEQDLRAAIATEGPVVQLPRWQRHKGGFNDRFAICKGERAIKAYGMRLDQALPFCQTLNIELHSERLIRYALWQTRLPVRKLGIRASRVRADGRVVAENFATNSWKMVRNDLRFARILRR